MSTTNSNSTALTTTINIVPVQGIFDQYHSIVTFVGPAGDYFSAPISGVATLTSGTIAATPVNPLDITNKAYVDAVAQGLDIKDSVVASTTGNITLSGTQTVDGIALVAGDRCLVKNQTAAADNGIYVVAASAWARSTDMSTWAQVPGAFTFIETGSTLADTGWVCTSNAGGTLGVTAITFTQFSGGTSYTAGTGLTLVGSVFSLTNPVAINLGGTAGTSTPVAGAVPYGTGTAYAFTAAGTTGQVLTSATAGAPTWTTPFAGIAVTDDTTTNATRYPLFTSATTGTITGNNTSSTKLSFNPSTGILTATSFAGALNGTVGSTTPAAGAFTTLSATGAITYGGITLTNAVTGTGKMVLDTTPTISNATIKGGNFNDTFGGRLTLVTATPVMTSDQLAKTIIYYSPYTNNICPIYDGTYSVPTVFSEISLTLDATNATSGSVYDCFVYNDSGTIRLGYGPAWTSTSARGTGAGTTQISKVSGIWVNTVAITLRYSSIATTSVALNQATYVGSFYATAAGQTGMSYSPTAATGGNNNILALYNAYNRVRTVARSSDSTSSWTYGTASFRSSNNSNSNRVSYLDGLAQSVSECRHICTITPGAAQTAYASIGWDSTTSNAGGYGATYAQSNVAGTLPFTSYNSAFPTLGFHYFQALELATGTSTYNGSLTQMQLYVSLEM